MLNNSDLEKKINSELNTKVSSSKIVHETLNVSIEKDDLKEVLLFLKSNPDDPPIFHFGVSSTSPENINELLEKSFCLLELLYVNEYVSLSFHGISDR